MSSYHTCVQSKYLCSQPCSQARAVRGIKKYSNQMTNVQHNTTSLGALSYIHNLCRPSKCQSSHVKCHLYSEHFYHTVALTWTTLHASQYSIVLKVKKGCAGCQSSCFWRFLSPTLLAWFSLKNPFSLVKILIPPAAKNLFLMVHACQQNQDFQHPSLLVVPGVHSPNKSNIYSSINLELYNSFHLGIVSLVYM